MSSSIIDSPFIHPEWHDIVPPIYSRTHPSQYNPFGYQHEPNIGFNLHSQTPSPPHPFTSFSQDTTSPVTRQTGRQAHKVNEKGEGPSLDRFALSYTPQWLQQLPSPLNCLYLGPSTPFPPPDYAADVFTPKLLSNPLPIKEQCPSILSLIPAKGPSLPLQPKITTYSLDYYAIHFSNLLSLHLSALLNDTTHSSIPFTLIQPHPIPGLQNTYRIHVPGIREDAPRLNIGDRMIIRGLYQRLRQASQNSIEAEVVGFEKAKSWVYVQSPYLGLLDGDIVKSGKGIRQGNQSPGIPAGNGSGIRCQIKFLLNVKPICDMQDAVRTFGLLHGIGWETVQRWIFPEIQYVREEIQDRPLMNIEWVDPGLNDEQKSAIIAIVSRDHKVPYLISGPPGVGLFSSCQSLPDIAARANCKTKTLVEAALQILTTHPNSTILVCAPSNSAADTLARRLCVPGATSASRPHVGPGTVLRLNLSSRTFAEVPDEILPFCYITSTPTGTSAFGLPSFAELMEYRVVICTCQDASILVTANATNIAMMKAESEMMDTFHRVSESSMIKDVHPHWTHLLIDEAAQASEPETLIPLSVVVPYPLPKGFRSVDPVVVLCGDIHQLGPIISSPEARDGELDVSLIERLFQQEVYASHSNARKNQKSANGACPSDWEGPFMNLIQNYRSIAPILMIPAALFYDDTLIPAARDVELLKWQGFPNPNIPILFYGCEGEENWIDEVSISWYNSSEIEYVNNVVQSLMKTVVGLNQKEIAVITPWREQVWRIRSKLRSNNLHAVDVGNVETYQGAEFRVTIISCVRSRSRFLDEDRRMNMGFFNERKRFNVAITRAKEILIVVGNGNLLKRDPYWNGFLQIMLRNNLYRGPELDLEMTGAYISRLESTIHRNEEHDPEEAVLRLAGALARETLRDD
ncbi:hypothetical protein V865_002083 [Kwoniella europaea PYCC6329]|uniref:RNA helicase n=1 Tax=Kwoniella europaea PYCC6329 TaxID=1423913 RepID=A0AAX4KEP7_9TREE